MRISHLAQANSTYRTWRKAVSLQQTIAARLDYYTKHHAKDLNWAHQRRAREALEELATLTREINSSLSSREMIRQPVKQTLEKIFLGLPQPGKAQLKPIEQQIVDDMTVQGQQSRAAKQRFLLMCEIAYRAKNDYFMLFNTLTVDDQHFTTVFSKDSVEFKNYIRRFNNYVGDDHTYFAVVEEGGKTGRLHIHVLHFFKTMPEDIQDPNKGRRQPIYRELRNFAALWENGFSSPVMIRYSPLDAYGKAGYRWPLDTTTMEPYSIGSPFRVSSYISKYIMKGYKSCKRNPLLWRVRKPHRLGLALLEQLLSTLTWETLLTISQCQTFKIRWNSFPIPTSLLSVMALKEYSRRSTNSPLPYDLLQEGKHIMPVPSPLQSFRGSTHKTAKSNRQNTSNSTTAITPNEATFDRAWKELSAAARVLDRDYFAPATAFGSTGSGDYFIHTYDPDAPASTTPATIERATASLRKQRQTSDGR